MTTGQEWGPCPWSVPVKDGSAKVRSHTHTHTIWHTLHAAFTFLLKNPTSRHSPPNSKQMVKVWLRALLCLNSPLLGEDVSVVLEQSGFRRRGRVVIGWEAHLGAGARGFNLDVIVACSCCVFYSWSPVVTESIWCCIVSCQCLTLSSHCVGALRHRLKPFHVHFSHTSGMAPGLLVIQLIQNLLDGFRWNFVHGMPWLFL